MSEGARRWAWTLGVMSNDKPFIPRELRIRLAWATGSALCGAIFLGLFGQGVLSWGTGTYWIFVGAIFCLAIGLHGKIE